MDGSDTDIAILGGGLAGGLIALALARLRPELRLLVIERDHGFGGNHIWSCFGSDVAPEHEWLVEPLIAARWDGYEVRFPGHERRLTTPYRSLTGERLEAALRAALPPAALLTGIEVAEAGQTRVTLADGRSFAAKGVIDARGAAGFPDMVGGWQKFFGQMLRLSRPHGLTGPIVMDATVAQRDGFRFVYCLPFSQHDIFVEDTYYSDSPALDQAALAFRITEYARRHGWQVEAVTRAEAGVLPVIADGDFAAFWPDDIGPARAGVRAALVNPLTSYSLPDAVRFAMLVAGLDDVSGGALAAASRAHAAAHWKARGLYRLLGRMLFGAAEPNQWYKVLERFYALPEPLIERFYAGGPTRADQWRILAGKPPVPLFAALASAAGRGRPLSPLERGR